MERLLLVTVLVFVEWGALGPTVRAQETDLEFSPVNAPSELLRSSVYAILQDRLGYLWFGTGTGLHRFDGYELITYDHDLSDSTSLARNTVWSLVEGERGRLWVVNSQGIQILDRRSGQFTPPVSGSERIRGNPPNVGRLVKSRGGRIWWVHKDHRPMRYDSASGGFRQIDGIPAIRALYEDSHGSLWYSTEEYGLFRYDPASGMRRHFGPSPGEEWVSAHAIDAIHRGRSGPFWIVTRAGVGAFDPETGRFRLRAELRPEPSHRPSRLIVAGEGTLWIRSVAELYRFDTDTYELERSIHSTERDLWAVHPSRSGTVWAGLLGGLYRWSPHGAPFAHLGSEADRGAGLSSGLVTAIYEDSDRPGTVWVGTIGGGLNRIDRSGERVTHFLDAPSSSSCAAENVWSIHEDRSDILWLGTDCGLHRFDRDAGTFRVFLPRPDRRDDHLQNNVDVITEDSAGRLWLGTYWGDLFRFDRAEERFVSVRRIEAPIRTLHVDESDQLWIGTQGLGLLRMDLERDRLRRYPHGRDDRSGLDASQVWFIRQAGNGALWLGTALGLTRFDPRMATFDHVYDGEEGPGTIVYGILKDDGGRLWLSTDRGLTTYDPRAPEGRRFHHYTASDGLGNTEFNRRAAFENRRGRFFFGGTNGVTSFHPDRVRKNPHVPPVVFTRVRKSSRDTTVSVRMFGREKLVLSPRDYTVEFEFAALDYTNPEKNRYAYVMEGFDADWNRAETRRFARYTNLPAGEYVFRVRGSNDDGVWNREGAAISLIVQAPFWQTWWFRLLVGLFLVGIGAGVYQYRVHRHREMQQLRLRIAQDLHDDIGASLGSIALSSDMIRRRFSSDSPDRDRLDRIARTAREMSADLREIVWLVSPHQDRLDRLVERMRQLTATLLGGISYSFQVSDDLPIDALEMSFRRNFLLIYKEILHNVVRHAHASRVVIHVKVEDGSLVLRVVDDGIGFDGEESGAGHGLPNMQMRAREIGGHVEIESAPERGTAITVTARIT